MGGWSSMMVRMNWTSPRFTQSALSGHNRTDPFSLKVLLVFWVTLILVWSPYFFSHLTRHQFDATSSQRILCLQPLHWAYKDRSFIFKQYIIPYLGWVFRWKSLQRENSHFTKPTNFIGLESSRVRRIPYKLFYNIPGASREPSTYENWRGPRPSGKGSFNLCSL